MSNYHAHLERLDERWLIVDHDGVNTTVVNGQRVGRCFLTDGDEIIIGRTRLRFRAGQDPPLIDAP